MKKLVLLFIFCFGLYGCGNGVQDVQPIPEVKESFKSITTPAKFELTDCGSKDCVKPILDLVDDRNFTLTLNMCESVEEVEGSYVKVDDEYFLAVNKCTSCKSDRGLSTVNLELKQVANDELKITNDVYRIEDGQKLGFCAPSNDPYEKYDGFDYNLFKLVKGY